MLMIIQNWEVTMLNKQTTTDQTLLDEKFLVTETDLDAFLRVLIQNKREFNVREYKYGEVNGTNAE